jgi:hypothetical protein
MRTLNQVRTQDTKKLKRTFVAKTRKGNPILYWPHLKEYRLIQNRAKVKVEDIEGNKTKVKIEDKVYNKEEKPKATVKDTSGHDQPIQLKRIKIEED